MDDAAAAAAAAAGQQPNKPPAPTDDGPWRKRLLVLRGVQAFLCLVVGVLGCIPITLAQQFPGQGQSRTVYTVPGPDVLPAAGFVCLVPAVIMLVLTLMAYTRLRAVLAALVVNAFIDLSCALFLLIAGALSGSASSAVLSSIGFVPRDSQVGTLIVAIIFCFFAMTLFGVTGVLAALKAFRTRTIGFAGNVNGTIATLQPQPWQQPPVQQPYNPVLQPAALYEPNAASPYAIKEAGDMGASGFASPYGQRPPSMAPPGMVQPPVPASLAVPGASPPDFYGINQSASRPGSIFEDRTSHDATSIAMPAGRTQRTIEVSNPPNGYGLDLRVSVTFGGVEITKVIPGRYGAQLGLQVGDVIVEIDGQNVARQSLDVVRAKFMAARRMTVSSA